MERLSLVFWNPKKQVSLEQICSWKFAKQIFHNNSIELSNVTNDISKENLQNEHIKSDHYVLLKKVIKKEFFNHISKNFISLHNLNDSKPLDELQYALYKSVNSLIDNSQKMQSNNLLKKGRPLKSISDQLKGKEGRFRQHLLGKRVDYSARSVIIVGPTLKLYECGIPVMMALKLFQPFLILYVIHRFHIASLIATKLIQQKHPIIMILLKKFIETWPIILNRAPTLHRMNIQSFKMKLVQGKAILLHPLVCSSFNADFDGDQMGIHVPITQQSRAEAWKLLWSINNLISLASRQPLFLPTQDMVIGNFYLTRDSFYQSISPLYTPFFDSSYISPKISENSQKNELFSFSTFFSPFFYSLPRSSFVETGKTKSEDKRKNILKNRRLSKTKTKSDNRLWNELIEKKKNLYYKKGIRFIKYILPINKDFLFSNFPL
uniref:RNA polymerase beta' subunit n=1 Tax=Cephaleuros lagerheimii TaxID=2738443 RepID=UPI0030013D36